MRDVKETMRGIQLAIFEIIWPSFPWIEKILLVPEDHKWLIYIQVRQKPDPIETADCRRLFDELLSVAAKNSAYALMFEQDSMFSGGIELMSDEIFKRIAQEMAPWRLVAGR